MRVLRERIVVAKEIQMFRVDDEYCTNAIDCIQNITHVELFSYVFVRLTVVFLLSLPLSLVYTPLHYCYLHFGGTAFFLS